MIVILLSVNMLQRIHYSRISVARDVYVTAGVKGLKVVIIYYAFTPQTTNRLC